jgi:multiple sugar transport system permease protein/alpha-1,4-digalacturonate transport system permease protein
MSEEVLEAEAVEAIDGSSAARGADRPRPTQKQRASALRRRNTALGWSFILPNFVGFALITMVPIFVLFYMAFTKYSFGNFTWIGLGNFERMIRNSSFRTALWNTFYYAVPHVLLTGAMGLGLALLLNRKLKGVAFFRAAAFFPYITSIVAIAIVWNLMFSPDYGPINQILSFLGVDNPPGWTTKGAWTSLESEWARRLAGSPSMWAVIIVGAWREMGYYMLLFLAGLQTIPHELYEAADVDGANAWQRFKNITWPGLRPTTFFITVILCIESFKVLDLVMVMTDGGPGTSTTVIAQYIYTKAIVENDMGYASACSLVLFTICLTVTLIQFFINKRSQR